MFAGVKRNSLSYDQIIQLLNGGEIKVTNKDRFFRSMTSFNVKIKDSVGIIKQNADKELVNNEYIPKHVQLLNAGSSIKPYLNTINNTYNKIIKLQGL